MSIFAEIERESGPTTAKILKVLEADLRRQARSIARVVNNGKVVITTLEVLGGIERFETLPATVDPQESRLIVVTKGSSDGKGDAIYASYRTPQGTWDWDHLFSWPDVDTEDPL